jgi:hypothetical protein
MGYGEVKTHIAMFEKETVVRQRVRSSRVGEYSTRLSLRPLRSMSILVSS